MTRNVYDDVQILHKSTWLKSSKKLLTHAFVGFNNIMAELGKVFAVYVVQKVGTLSPAFTTSSTDGIQHCGFVETRRKSRQPF